MSKRKKPAVEAFDKEGPQNLPDGYTWCHECQASYQGEVCPGCVDLSGAGADPAPAAAGAGGEPPDPTTLGEVAANLPDVETTTITEILPVALTISEQIEIGKKQAQAGQEIVQAKNELKSVKSQYKSRIDSAEARRDEYGAIINAGHQQKPVECQLVKDFKENTITLIRLDTMEEVRTRTMAAAERQRGLFPGGAAAEAGDVSHE
jgi:hypothetical protein